MRRNGSSPFEQPTRPKLHGAVVGGIVLLLAASWSSTPVLAAANEQISGRMQSLGKLDDRPVVDLVDLSDVESSLDAAGPATHAGQPDSLLLFLAPRVVNILEDVFRDSKMTAAAADTGSRWKVQEEQDASSPLAGNTDPPDRADAEPDSGMYENDAILPRFQRQMYRTDI